MRLQWRRGWRRTAKRAPRAFFLILLVPMMTTTEQFILTAPRVSGNQDGFIACDMFLAEPRGFVTMQADRYVTGHTPNKCLPLFEIEAAEVAPVNIGTRASRGNLAVTRGPRVGAPNAFPFAAHCSNRSNGATNWKQLDPNNLQSRCNSSPSSSSVTETKGSGREYLLFH